MSAVERVFREQYGRAVAVLVRAFGDIDLAEEAVQEAFAVAVRQWPEAGMPPSPAGWIITTARNRAIDRLRRESSRHERQVQAVQLYDADPPVAADGPVHDDRLRLIFTCCHPALAVHAQVALTLRLLGGLTTAEIARAFLVPEATMAQRLVRAKSKIRRARIPYRVPGEGELPERLRAVLAVVYLIFNEGYAASSGDRLVREDLCAEAVRLGRLLAALMPDEPEVKGLLALMLLIEARRPARTGADGRLVPLAEQDRALGDRALIEEGQDLVRWCLRRDTPGPYQVQAAINAVHGDAARARETDWRQILRLYDLLLTLDPTPVVAVNRAVAVAEVEGPRAALRLVDDLDADGYHLFHAVRADLLRRLGRSEEAARAYEAAIARSGNDVERAFLRAAAQRLAGAGLVVPALARGPAQPARDLPAAGRTHPRYPGRVRLAGPADQAAVEQLVHDAYTPWIEAVGVRPLPLEADYGALIAAGRVHVTDSLDGLVVLVPEDGALLVENVAVRPETHGRGIGRALLAYAEDEARRLGLPALRLYTNVKMTSNIRLYASLGYVETRRAGIEGRQAVLMRKSLSP
ncbi:GNAT family N-acetyltransferase [Nonomuraea aridisoli]|uniref:GNAT family N-acetyltransferase n=1 Tax=Nonomuraea aridisoli TaxID=2070368 RepID=UPI002E26DAD7